MEKYLITGEVYEYKKLYALFFTGKYFVCDLQKLRAILKPTELDLKILRKMANDEFINELLENNDNYWYSLTVDNDDESIIISNIKCYRNPQLISYQYESFKSLMEMNQIINIFQYNFFHIIDDF